MNNHPFEQAQQKNRSKKNGKIILLLMILAVIFIIVMYLLSETVFIIKHVKINDLKIYDSKAILNDIGAVEDSSLFFTSFSDKKDELKSKYPYITNIEFKRVLPNTLDIRVTEDRGSMCIGVGSEIFLLTDNLDVIAILSEVGESEKLLGENVKRINIITGKVSRCVTGETIKFSEDYIFEAIRDIYSALCACGIEDKISYIDLTNKFYIKLKYDDRFTVQFGDWKNAVDKTKMFTKVAGKFDETSKGSIDVSATREAIVSLD